jgi:hypothetical protein
MTNFMERHANVAAQSTSIATVIFGGLSLNELALLVGIVCSVGTLLINWWYKHKEYKRITTMTADGKVYSAD